MSEIEYPLSAEDGHDDLPRTLRREKEARERERREKEAKDRTGGRRGSRLQATRDGPDGTDVRADDPDYPVDPYEVDGPAVPAVVRQFDVPFVSLVMFFLKAVLAAIPALILLGVVIWMVGEILQQLFPWLVKMQIFVHFPE